MFKKLGILALGALLLFSQPAYALKISDAGTSKGQVHKLNFTGLTLSFSAGVWTISASTAAITAGTIAGVVINNSSIGATTPSTGAFTTLGATGASTLSGDVTGDGGDQLVGFLQNQVASTTTALTAAQCGSTIVSDSGDVVTLPEASTVLGCRYTFAGGTADDLDINPADGTDVIGAITASGGTITPSAGDAIRITDVGASVTLEATGANAWAAVGHNGAITDVN